MAAPDGACLTVVPAYVIISVHLKTYPNAIDAVFGRYLGRMSEDDGESESERTYGAKMMRNYGL